MFTGIVEEIGTVTQLQRSGNGYSLALHAQTVLEDTRLGDSIAVNGVCLTVTRLLPNGFVVGLSPETRQRTNLARLAVGDAVNLERSLTPSSRLGGHFVQGHVDGIGVVTAFRPDGDAIWVTVEAPPALLRYIVPKGYVALDGVSLTVVDVFDASFTVTLVVYTQQHITLTRQQTGYTVNLEVDILGKYIEKLLDARADQSKKPGLSLDFLAEHGYQ